MVAASPPSHGPFMLPFDDPETKILVMFNIGISPPPAGGHWGPAGGILSGLPHVTSRHFFMSHARLVCVRLWNCN